MADAPVVHIGENSPEHVAYRLFCRVGVAEQKTSSSGFLKGDADRKWFLDTYAECLATVRDPFARL